MKNIYRDIIQTSCLALLISVSTSVTAQQPIEIRQKVPYYIDVNQSEKSQIHEIQESYLSLQYNDQFGTQKQIQLKIYNWKLEPVGLFTLDKAFGLNNYNIDLQDISPLEDNVNYLCRMTDESGVHHEWYIKTVPARKTEIQADIFVNPLTLKCASEEENLVEYYGQISNGRGPYTIRWYILNDTKTDFLYQPREDQLNDPGKTSVVQVDKVPDYYVVMDVTDACGATSRKMILMSCENKKKVINTVFVEPLQLPPAMLKQGN